MACAPAIPTRYERRLINHRHALQTALHEPLFFFPLFLSSLTLTILIHPLQRTPLYQFPEFTPPSPSKYKLRLVHDLPKSRGAVARAHAHSSLRAEYVHIGHDVLMPEKRLDESHHAEVVQPERTVARAGVELEGTFAKRERLSITIMSASAYAAHKARRNRR